jgi:hypothetical protein
VLQFKTLLGVVFKPHTPLACDFHPGQAGRQDPTEIEWEDAMFGQNEVLSTPQVPPTVVTARARGVRWAIVVAS